MIASVFTSIATDHKHFSSSSSSSSRLDHSIDFHFQQGYWLTGEELQWRCSRSSRSRRSHRDDKCRIHSVPCPGASRGKTSNLLDGVTFNLLPCRSAMHPVFRVANFDALKTTSLVYGSLCTGRFTWTSVGVNLGEASSHQVPILQVLKNIDSISGAKSACRIWLEALVANLWQCRCRP